MTMPYASALAAFSGYLLNSSDTGCIAGHMKFAFKRNRSSNIFLYVSGPGFLPDSTLPAQVLKFSSSLMKMPRYLTEGSPCLNSKPSTVRVDDGVGATSAHQYQGETPMRCDSS